MYELHKTWCADTLLSNSVICAIGVLQHDKQKCWSPKCISSAPLRVITVANMEGKNSLLGTDLVHKQINSNSYKALQDRRLARKKTV